MLCRAFSLSRLGAAAGILLIASLLVAPNATAATLSAPSGLGPNGPVASTTPAFSWTRVSGATGYEFQVDDSDDFSSPIQTVTTTNRTYVPTVRLKAGTSYWRVRANGLEQCAIRWSRAEVVVDGTAPPSPISPIDGAPLTQPRVTGAPPVVAGLRARSATRSRSTLTGTGSAPTAYNTPGTSVPGAHAAGARGVALAGARGPRQRHVHGVVRPPGRRDVRDPAPRGRAARPDDGDSAARSRTSS